MKKKQAILPAGYDENDCIISQRFYKLDTIRHGPYHRATATFDFEPFRSN